MPLTPRPSPALALLLVPQQRQQVEATQQRVFIMHLLKQLQQQLHSAVHLQLVHRRGTRLRHAAQRSV
jgi:hypothetical protein